jgi:hypothetical protein
MSRTAGGITIDEITISGSWTHLNGMNNIK